MELIYRDCDGIGDHFQAVAAAFPGKVHRICPHHLHISGATRIEIPERWLPTTLKLRPRREWFAAEALGLAAVKQLHIRAPFVWFVESDISGPVDVWKQVFQSTADSTTDGIFAKLLPRDHAFARPLLHWQHPHTPKNASHCHLMTLYRLSARAIEWCSGEAEATREIYAEVKTASAIHHRGGTVADLAEFCRYSGPRSFTGSTKSHRFRPGVLNHPVKY